MDEATEAMLMIEPRPFFSMPGMKARDTRNIDLHVDREALVPVLRSGVEDAAVVDDAGAVEEHIRFAGFARHLGDGRLVGDVQYPGSNASLPLEVGKGGGIHIARPDLRAFASERERRRASHPLRRRGDERHLACQTSCHEGSDYTSRNRESA